MKPISSSCVEAGDPAYYGTPQPASVQVVVPLPIQFILFLLVGWVSRQQLDVIEYLKAENRAVRSHYSTALIPFAFLSVAISLVLRG